MLYSLLYSDEAKKGFRHLDKPKAAILRQKLETLAKNPYAQNNNTTFLKNTSNGFRLRVGNFRVIYELDSQNKVVYIHKIKPRSSAYRP